MITDLFMHVAVVSSYSGATPTGDGYGGAVPVRGFLDDGVVLAHEAGGEQLQSKTVFYTDLDNAALFLPESLVVCNGRSMQVTAVRRRDGGGILGEVSHLEVDLT